MWKALSMMLIILFPMHVFASIGIVGLLPNPAGDDTLGEYIDIVNTGCSVFNIGGYRISDASGKTYVIPYGAYIESQEIKRFPYSVTKIPLNNTGDESVYLHDSSGSLVDEIHYTGTQKDDIPILLSVSLENCSVQSTNSGNTETDIILPGGDSLGVSSGSVLSESGGVLFDSGSISGGTGEMLVTSGTTYSGSIDVSTGSSFSGNMDDGLLNNSWGIYTETGVLNPVFMYYADMDNNKHIDTLEIEYPYMLTGAVNAGSIFLYSNTGGLSSRQINTETGYILSASLSGNTLILRLLEGDIESTALKINNTTTSAIRIKSSSDLGFRSIGGQIPGDLLLTKSFDEYRNVRPKLETGGTSVIEQSSSNYLPQDGSGMVTFPEITPTFQNYTNTSNSGDVITCTTMPCRVNLTLEPIFTGAFIERDYSCRIIFGTGIYDSCNPPQLYPTASGVIQVTLTHKSTKITHEKIFSVEFSIPTTSQGPVMGLSPPMNNRPPVANIDMDGKWKKYFTSPEIHLIRCYAFTCSVNFTGENSYDPDGDSIRFLWIYDYGSTSEKRDPGTKTFHIGNHTIILRVIDVYGAFGEQKIRLEVMHPDSIPMEEKEEIKKRIIAEKKKIVSGKISSKKKKKPRPIIFYDVPEISIQNKHPENISIKGNRYTCYTKTKTCSINFSLTGDQKGYRYEWIFPEQSGSYISKNPRSFSFSIGSSVANLIVRDLAGNIMTTQDINVQVIKTTKSRTKKEIPPKEKVIKELSEKLQERKIPEKIPPSDRGFSEDSKESSIAILIFLSAIGSIGYIRAKNSVI